MGSSLPRLRKGADDLIGGTLGAERVALPIGLVVLRTMEGL